MKTDVDIFLRTPEHEMLYPGTVSATTDKGYKAVFEGWAFSLEDGAEVLVFYEINRRFMQQPVRVLSVVEKKNDDDGTRITLELEDHRRPDLCREPRVLPRVLLLRGRRGAARGRPRDVRGG